MKHTSTVFVVFGQVVSVSVSILKSPQHPVNDPPHSSPLREGGLGKHGHVLFVSRDFNDRSSKFDEC